MAVWHHRRNEADYGWQWIKVTYFNYTLRKSTDNNLKFFNIIFFQSANEILPKYMDSFLAVRAFTRIVESELLSLRNKQKNNEKEQKKYRQVRKQKSIDFLIFCHSIPIHPEIITLLSCTKEKKHTNHWRFISGCDEFCGEVVLCCKVSGRSCDLLWGHYISTPSIESERI